MDFFELVYLFSLTVALPLIIFKSILDYKRQKLKVEQVRQEGHGLTVGELKQALRETVAEANAPVLERLEVLERAALPPASAPIAGIEGAEVEDGEAEQPSKTLGRRVTS